jgi:hypothetical protein
MKLKITLACIVFISFSGFGQNDKLEKSLFGIQAGYIGIWGYNETNLTNQLALRTELGIASGVFGSEFGVVDGVFERFKSDEEFLVSPMISIEPRWYYNLNRRESQSKDISSNSGNFLSVKVSYNLNSFVFPIDQDINISQISLLTNWGIRRNIGNNFNFESGLGFGYLFSDDRAVINLHLRLGYVFKKKRH